MKVEPRYKYQQLLQFQNEDGIAIQHIDKVYRVHIHMMTYELEKYVLVKVIIFELAYLNGIFILYFAPFCPYQNYLMGPTIPLLSV